MKKEITKKRPCRPGDVLFRLKTDFGAEAIVTLGQQTKHPESGVFFTKDIIVCLQVRLPCVNDGDVLLCPSIRSDDVSVLGVKLRPKWGSPSESSKYRSCYVDFCYPDVLTGFTKAVDLAKESIATVQEVFDAHKRSVDDLEQYRKAAFDAFWVDDDASNPEGGSND